MSDRRAAKSKLFPSGSVVRRPLIGWLKFIAYHTGIYVGDRRVIHLSEKPDKNGHAQVREDSLEDFAAGHQVVLHQPPGDEEQGREVVARARAALKKQGRGPYSRWSNNCEDFTEEMFEGKRHPKKQVKKIWDGVVVVLVGVVVVLAAVGASSKPGPAADDDA